MDQIKSYNGLRGLNEHGDLSFLFYFLGTDIGREHLIKKFKKNFWIIFYLRIHLKGGTRKGTQFDLTSVAYKYNSKLLYL